MPSLSTATTIGNSDVVPHSSGPDENGKYAGHILYGPSHHHAYMPLLSTGPMFESEAAALERMRVEIQKFKEQASANNIAVNTVLDNVCDSQDNDIILDIKGVCQHFGTGVNRNNVLHDVNLQIMRGQFVALVGASGCGKSTLLRAILGTDPPKEGTITINNKPVLGPNRNVGIVYQKYGLYQFLTAEENVAFGLMLDQTNMPFRLLKPWKWWPKRKQHLKQAREMLTKVKLENSFEKYPSELSGGMQQRVALAQSLIMKPEILVLDESLGALDVTTRAEIQAILLHLYQENVAAVKAGTPAPWTVIIVTHDQDEALYLSDRLVGLGRNWQEGDKDGKILGATKVYDKCTPVFHPDAPRNFDVFFAQKQELRATVFNHSVVLDRNEHVSFWSDLEHGVGTGIAMMD